MRRTPRPSHADSVTPKRRRVQPLDLAVIVLARRRIALGLSQEKVAQRMGYQTYHQVASWERGDHSPSVAAVRRWAAALGYELVVREVGRG
jgi:Helix-turn-helix.